MSSQKNSANFQLVTDDFYDNLSQRLQELVPEFQPDCSDSDYGKYLIIIDFRNFLLANINDVTIRNKCFLCIDEALRRGKTQTADLIISEIFEEVYPNESLLKTFREGLLPLSLSVFETFTRTQHEIP